jgi:hypothetical protein
LTRAQLGVGASTAARGDLDRGDSNKQAVRNPKAAARHARLIDALLRGAQTAS